METFSRVRPSSRACILIFAIFAVWVAQASAQNTEQCIINCRNVNNNQPLVDGNYAYCNNCSQFMSCTAGRADLRDCPRGTNFYNRLNDQCDSDPSVCRPNDTPLTPIPTTPTTTPTTTTTTTTRRTTASTTSTTTTTTTTPASSSGFVPTNNDEAATYGFAIDLYNRLSGMDTRVTAGQVQSVTTEVLSTSASGQVTEMFYRFNMAQLVRTVCPNTQANMGATLQQCPIAIPRSPVQTCYFTVRYFPQRTPANGKFDMQYLSCN